MSFWSSSLFSKWAEDVADTCDHPIDRAKDNDPSPSPLPIPATSSPSSRFPRSTSSRRPRYGRQSSFQTMHHYMSMWKTLVPPSQNSILVPSKEPQHRKETRPTPTESDIDDQVDIVVVDRCWASQPDTSRTSAAMSTVSLDQETSGASTFGGASVRISSLRHGVRHLIARILHFFHPVYDNPEREALYQHGVWEQHKYLALWGSLFFVVNWVLGISFVQPPLVLADKV
jgi:hypothetical protein